MLLFTAYYGYTTIYPAVDYLISYITAIQRTGQSLNQFWQDLQLLITNVAERRFNMPINYDWQNLFRSHNFNNVIQNYPEIQQNLIIRIKNIFNYIVDLLNKSK